MPVFDTPITTNDQSISKVLGQKQPAILMLHDGRQADKPLQDAIAKAAKKHAGDLLVVRIDVQDSPETYAKYGNPTLPALIALSGGRRRDETSRAEAVRPADVRAHIAHLLNGDPLPEAKAKAASTSAGKPLAVNDKTFRQEVLKSDVPVLVDFWAPWCGPCHSIAPHVEKLAQEYAGRVKVVKLDTDQNQVIARRFDIRSIPTFILFDGGQPVERMSGANPGGLRRMLANASR